MLSTLLVKAPWSAFAVLVLVVVVAPFLGRWLALRHRVTGVLAALAAVAVLGLTLYPDGAPYPVVACNVGLPYLSPTAVEVVANVLLFVPVTFLVALPWRRPVAAVLVASAGSAAIEGVQAVVLAIGRACDTSDWITNTVGAVIGGALAAVSLAWVRRSETTATTQRAATDATTQHPATDATTQHPVTDATTQRPANDATTRSSPTDADPARH